MPDHDPTARLVENLLSQDPDLTQDALRRQRMELELKLEETEEFAKKVRRASLIGVGITVAFWIGILPFEFFRLGAIHWARVTYVVLGNLSLLTTGVLLTLYWHKYRPAIDRQRVDLQMTMLRDMQQQIEEIRAAVKRD